MIFEKTFLADRPCDDRKGVIGSSQVGAIMDVDGYGTPYSVWEAYMGLTKPPDKSLAWTFAVGHALEQPIAELFSLRTGLSCVEHPKAIASAEHPFLICHPDREIVSPDGRRYALECKTASSFAVRKRWPALDPAKRLSLPFVDPDAEIYDGSLVLDQYRCQLYWYTAFGYDGVFLARLTDNKLFIHYLESDPKIERAIADAAIEFVRKADAGWVPPMESADAKRAEPPAASPGEARTADGRTAAAVDRLAGIKSEIRELKAAEDELAQQVKSFMGAAETLVDGAGRALCAWRQTTRSGIDAARLKSEAPDVWSKYLKETTFRTFNVLVK